MRRPTSAESPIDIRIPVHSRGHSSIATDRQWRHCSKGSEQALLPVPQNYRGSACSSRTRPRHMNTHQSAHRWPRLQCARADRPSERCLVLSVCAHKALLSALRSKVTATLSRSSQECDRGKEVTASLTNKKKKVVWHFFDFCSGEIDPTVLAAHAQPHKAKARAKQRQVNRRTRRRRPALAVKHK